MRGIILPRRWNEDGSIKEIALSTISEEEFAIENSGLGRELKQYVRAEVEIVGTLKACRGVTVVSVSDYTVRKHWRSYDL